jgi:hypothetical protein
MKELARVSLAVTAIVASGWASVSAITACSSSNGSGSSSSSGSGGSSSGTTSSSSGASGSSGSSSSGGSCTLNASFGNVNTGTCPECATCVSPYCCSSINACYMDPGCAALMACEFGCYGGTLPGDAAAPDGGDCPTLCTADVDAGAISRSLYTAETTCWENGGAGSTACANACMCNGTTGDAGGDDGGGDATTPPAEGGTDAGGSDAGGG